MKRAIILVLTTFLAFLIFIISGKSANAELTPVTPFYGGDIFNGQELYLFQNYSATPNFQNGYISKQTITNQDLFYQENSYYNGWYKNLGEDLIYEYTEPEHEPEHPIFYFYITLNGLLSQYFQFALIAPEPFEAEYTIKFRNENPFVFLTTNQYNDYLVTPPTTDMTKEIEWFCFEVYFPDYMASFKPLTAQLAYDFGFSSGEREGYNNGYFTGYTNGYNNAYDVAYNQGLEDAAQVGFVEVQLFNQLCPNNITTGVGYTRTTSTITITDNTVTNFNNINRCGIGVETITGHKYYIKIFSDTPYLRLYNYYSTSVGFEANDGVIRNENHGYPITLGFAQGIENGTYELYINFIDLTAMFGEGNEPNITTCRSIFNIKYPYCYDIPLNINYLNGYQDGEIQGIEKGKDIQATKQLTSTGWISSIFGGISSLLNIQILPGVTIGIIVGIPFIISLAYFVIRAFRGGGGD